MVHARSLGRLVTVSFFWYSDITVSNSARLARTAPERDNRHAYSNDTGNYKYHRAHVLIAMAENGNTIGDMLDRDFGSEANELPFDFDEEEYDQVTDFERGIEFDILWDETGQYPPTIDDDVVHAILDDEGHNYRVTIGDDRRETSVMGIALFAHLDDEADVEVAS